MRIPIVSALIVVAVLVLLFIWWRFFDVARPEVPPLVIEPNDLLMQEAVRKAKDSIPRFRVQGRREPTHRASTYQRGCGNAQNLIAPRPGAVLPQPDLLQYAFAPATTGQAL